MILPDAAFLHRLADLADAETMPRYRTDIAVDTRVKEGCSFDPVTKADGRQKLRSALRSGRIFLTMPSSARN